VDFPVVARADTLEAATSRLGMKVADYLQRDTYNTNTPLVCRNRKVSPWRRLRFYWIKTTDLLVRLMH
jgi:hypothetical protein